MNAPKKSVIIRVIREINGSGTKKEQPSPS